MRDAPLTGVAPLTPPYVHDHIRQSTGASLKETTLTEWRNHAKDYFDIVERWSPVRVFGNGKPIAEIVPIRSGIPTWQRPVTPLTIKGLSLGLGILGDREESP